MVQLVSSQKMIHTSVFVLHLSRELCVQRQSSVTRILVLTLELVTRTDLDITVRVDWDTLEATAKVTCVILARVCTVDIVACFMVTRSVTVLRFTKETSVKFLIRATIALV